MVIQAKATYQIADYHFTVSSNPANVAGQMQHDVFYRIGEMDAAFLRSFYFDDTDAEIIRAFCEQFAYDVDYREASLERQTDWAICNDLFLRNCFNPYFQANPVLVQLGSLVRAYNFFKNNADMIVQQSDYQRIYQIDSSFVPHPHQPDSNIADAISIFNQIAGVKTIASCQGVSGTIRCQNMDILTLSPHARYAFIWFDNIPAPIKQRIQAYDFSSTVYSDEIYPMLQSTGDNAAFLGEIANLANQLLGDNHG